MIWSVQRVFWEPRKKSNSIVPYPIGENVLLKKIEEKVRQMKMFDLSQLLFYCVKCFVRFDKSQIVNPETRFHLVDRYGYRVDGTRNEVVMKEIDN